MPLDDEAVAEIYREHGPMLRRVVWRATSDANRVEDIVQEVILRVWRQAPEADNLRAYLITTARHLIVDQHRAAGRRPQQTQLVEEALGRLQATHRDIVRCLYYERLTIAETSGRLGVPEGTVKSRAYYAVRNLRVILDEMGVTR